MKKTILFLFFIALCSSMLQAQPQRVQAAPYLMELEQPDGYKLRFYLRGDEWKSWRMTEDGYQILTKKDGFYYYATENCSGKAVASCHKAKNAEDRTPCEQKFLEKKGKKMKTPKES